MREIYTKNEIISAIKYKAKFDIQFEPMLVSIIQKLQYDKAYSDWEIAVKRSQETLRAFGTFTSELRAKYGKVSLLALSESEKQKYLKIAKESEEADIQQELCWKKLNNIQRKVCE